jgi:hypothetical protein
MVEHEVHSTALLLGKGTVSRGFLISSRSFVNYLCVILVLPVAPRNKKGKKKTISTTEASNTYGKA